MRFFPAIYQLKLSVAKSLLLLFLFVYTATNSFGQDQPVTDTLSAYVDSTLNFDDEIIEQNSDDESATEPESTYFNKLNAFQPDSFGSRDLPDSIMQKFRNEDAFWYANKIFKNKKQVVTEGGESGRGEARTYQQKEPITNESWFQTLLWIIIIGGFTTFVVLYLSNSNIRIFRKTNGRIDNIDESVETDDIFAIQYQREIDKATAAGNYRLAVRLMFLRLLKHLADKNIIQYKPDRTDFDYLIQLRSTKYYPEFFRLVRTYEYSWYGKFDVSPETFAQIKTNFENFDPTMNKS